MTYKDTTPPKLKKAVQFTERLIIKVLIALMSVLLVIATIEMGFVFFDAITETGDKHFLINLDNLMNIFGVFLLVVIGIELLDTIKVYFRKHVIHVEIVMLVALIAMSRKIIVMDYENLQGLEMLGIASIIVALAGGYFLIKKIGGCGFWPKEMNDSIEDVVITEKMDAKDNKVVERQKVTTKRRSKNLIGASKRDQDVNKPEDADKISSSEKEKTHPHRNKKKFRHTDPSQ